jgi:hypothetical protein
MSAPPSSSFTVPTARGSASPPWSGLLFVGDPHLAHRPVGHRTDDFSAQILAKLAWVFEYCRRERLLPALLGDLFHWPRDNSNALLGRAIELFHASGFAPVATLAGNHDMRYHPLADEDSLTVLVKAGCLDLIADRAVGDERRERIANREVILRGTNWGSPLPTTRAADADDGALIVWMTHHDLIFPGAEEVGRVRPPAMPGVAIAVNGHIHRPCAPVANGGTTWFNPGNITRVTRSVATRERHPGVLRIDVLDPAAQEPDSAPHSARSSEAHAEGDLFAPQADAAPLDDALIAAGDGWRARRVVVPHLPFEEVFHDPQLAAESGDAEEVEGESAFVRGLEALLARRTASGQGVRDYLATNLGAYPDDVAGDIRALADAVLAGDAVDDDND